MNCVHLCSVQEHVGLVDCHCWVIQEHHIARFRNNEYCVAEFSHVARRLQRKGHLCQGLSHFGTFSHNVDEPSLSACTRVNQHPDRVPAAQQISRQHAANVVAFTAADDTVFRIPFDVLPVPVEAVLGDEHQVICAQYSIHLPTGVPKMHRAAFGRKLLVGRCCLAFFDVEPGALCRDDAFMRLKDVVRPFQGFCHSFLSGK
mmetsp:Transcript_3979/g.10149  ORF Transcript_3979/g.10149 Transcript_3979/m.10149 type:complete len:202 (-) Transcript_3979:358-963(-)